MTAPNLPPVQAALAEVEARIRARLTPLCVCDECPGSYQQADVVDRAAKIVAAYAAEVDAAALARIRELEEAGGA